MQQNDYICRIGVIGAIAGITSNLKYNQMIAIFDKESKKMTLYSVHSDVARLFNVTPKTVWEWAKQNPKDTTGYILYFDVCKHISKCKRRKPTTMINLARNVYKCPFKGKHAHKKAYQT